MQQTIQSVTYLVEAPVVSVNGRQSSSLASTRYRAIVPSARLSRAGIVARFQPVDAGPISAVIPRGSEHAAVVSGFFSPATLRAAQEAKANGNRLLVDVGADQFDRPDASACVNPLCALADQLIASTPALAGRVREATGRDAVVISDPYQGPAGEALFDPAHGPLRLLWFGHAANFDTLVPLFQQLGVAMLSRPDFLLARREVLLEIVSSPVPPAMQELFAQVAQQFQGRLRITTIEWSEAATWQALQRAQIVTLPSLPGSADRSPNRLVESIRAGRLVVAHPVPSYEELGDYAMIGEDIGLMIEQVLRSDAAAITARLKAGQAHVEQVHSAAVIGEQWRRAMGA